MDDPATTLRELLQQQRPRTASLGWPATLRARVARHAATRRARGERWAAISRSLGVNRTTVRSWVEALDEALDEAPTVGAMVPVIVGEPPAVLAPPPATEPTVDAKVVLVSPRGFRLEGLSVSAAVSALERLG